MNRSTVLVQFNIGDLVIVTSSVYLNKNGAVAASSDLNVSKVTALWDDGRQQKVLKSSINKKQLPDNHEQETGVADSN